MSAWYIQGSGLGYKVLRLDMEVYEHKTPQIVGFSYNKDPNKEPLISETPMVEWV